MPPKITSKNYLTQGMLSPQIYLLAYIKPLSGYQIAKKRYGTPMGAQVYGYLKRMMTDGYIEHKTIIPNLGGTYRSLVAPLVESLNEAFVFDLTLSQREQKALTQFLDSDISRNAWDFFKPSEHAMNSNLNVVELMKHRLIIDSWLALNQIIVPVQTYPHPPLITAYNKAFKKLPKSLLTTFSTLASTRMNLCMSEV